MKKQKIIDTSEVLITAVNNGNTSNMSMYFKLPQTIDCIVLDKYSVILNYTKLHKKRNKY